MARKTFRPRLSWGQVERLPSGRYRARYTHEDRLYSAPHTFDTKTDAKEWLNVTRVDIQRGKWKNPKHSQAETFKPYAVAWIEQRRRSNGEPLRENTKADYYGYLRNGLAVFAGMRLDEITPAFIRAWHTDRAKAAATAAAVETRVLKAVLNTAVGDGLIDRNPVPGGLSRSKTGQAHRIPTGEELAIMLDVFEVEEPRLKLFVLLAAYGGLRFSEIRTLRRQDLTRTDGRYVVDITRQAYRSKADAKQWIVEAPKSDAGVRKVFLPSFLTGTVSNHLETFAGRFKASLLFEPVGAAEFLDNRVFNRTWNKARVAAGVRRNVAAKGKPARWVSDVREHDLRAYAGTLYAQGGATLKETMAVLGHSSTAAAMAYQHTTNRAGELADRMPELPAAPKPIPNINDRKTKGT